MQKDVDKTVDWALKTKTFVAIKGASMIMPASLGFLTVSVASWSSYELLMF